MTLSPNGSIINASAPTLPLASLKTRTCKPQMRLSITQMHTAIIYYNGHHTITLSFLLIT